MTESSKDMLPIRVFVAATPSEWLPTRVLEYTIRIHTRSPVEVTPIYSAERTIPVPSSPANRPRTPFSFQRFLIPELCAYQGRAIYLDSDMQVFADIGNLWRRDMREHDLLTVAGSEDDGRRGQFSVMLLDCARLDWRIEDIVGKLDEGVFSYEMLMYDMCVAASIGSTIGAEWNMLERFDPEHTSLLHYTDMNTQPWVAVNNPLAFHWVAALRAALSDEFISAEELEAEIDAGHVRPSLARQLESGEDDPRVNAVALRRLDAGFVPPYRKLGVSRLQILRGLVSAVPRGLRRRLGELTLSRKVGQ